MRQIHILHSPWVLNIALLTVSNYLLHVPPAPHMYHPGPPPLSSHQSTSSQSQQSVAQYNYSRTRNPTTILITYGMSSSSYYILFGISIFFVSSWLMFTTSYTFVVQPSVPTQSLFTLTHNDNERP
jgi:hypothetical protein